MNKFNCWLVVMIMTACVSQGQTVAFKWVDTFKLTGQGICQTAPFKLQSNEWRVAYRPNGRTPFEVLLCNGKTGTRSMITKQIRSGSPVSGRRKGAGTQDLAYLAISGEFAAWDVTVSQYLDVPGEWYLRKWKNPADRLLPYGSWTGESGERSWSVDVKDGMGRFVCTQNGPGRLALDIVDESGNHIGKMVSVAPGTLETWFYHPGVYTVTVSAIESGWNLRVDSVAK